MKIPMTHTYTDALTAIALMRIIDSKALNLLFTDSSRRAQFVKKAVEKGHIKKIDVDETRKQERKSKTLYAITESGLCFLANFNKPLFDLLEAKDNMRIFNDQESKESTKLRLAAVNTALLLSHCAGAAIPAETLCGLTADIAADGAGESVRNMYTLKDFMRELMLSENLDYFDVFNRECAPKDENYMVFHDRAFIKETLAEEIIAGSTNDYQAGRYAGIVESKHKCVMLYTAPMYTMSWSKWLIKGELDAYQMWRRTNSIVQSGRQLPHVSISAVIVGNARVFAYHFLSRKRQRDKTEVFGGQFTHVYIIPNDFNGVRFLNWLMRIDVTELENRVLKVFAMNNNFIMDQNGDCWTKDGAKLVVGLTLDAKRIQRIINYINRFPTQKIAIICLDWQKDYYRRVLPETVSYISMKMELLQKIYPLG